jgi:hypothetical protein
MINVPKIPVQEKAEMPNKMANPATKIEGV